MMTWSFLVTLTEEIIDSTATALIVIISSNTDKLQASINKQADRINYILKILVKFFMHILKFLFLTNY